jgi:malonyl CoA-acyl carrier protein transacylase
MKVSCAVEVGPGKILTGLGKRITSQVRFVTFEEALDGAI